MLYHYHHNCKHSKVEICFQLSASQTRLDLNPNDIQRNEEKISSKQRLIFNLCRSMGKQDLGWNLELPQLPLLEGSLHIQHKGP